MHRLSRCGCCSRAVFGTFYFEPRLSADVWLLPRAQNLLLLLRPNHSMPPHTHQLSSRYRLQASEGAHLSVVRLSLCFCAGVNFNLDNSLPQGSISLQGGNILFENSYFANLTERADGCIRFQDSTVAFQNATFVGNSQATAGAIFANNTVLSIDNSNFTNNVAPQAGAIQIIGSNSMLYINGTVFMNNSGMPSNPHAHLPLYLTCKYTHACTVFIKQDCSATDVDQCTCITFFASLTRVVLGSMLASLIGPIEALLDFSSVSKPSGC